MDRVCNRGVSYWNRYLIYYFHYPVIYVDTLKQYINYSRTNNNFFTKKFLIDNKETIFYILLHLI